MYHLWYMYHSLRTADIVHRLRILTSFVYSTLSTQYTLCLRISVGYHQRIIFLNELIGGAVIVTAYLELGSKVAPNLTKRSSIVTGSPMFSSRFSTLCPFYSFHQMLP